ncbi:MAG TPA: ABC transporter permease [Chloroflexota bacterium]|nr:ABC transporter permease [Chloroflexota bacterium]
MPIDYVLRRVGFFFLILWLAATLNFFIPRLSSQNPVRERMIEQAVLGGYVHAGMDQMVEEYERRFGLDQPLYIQYFRYMGDLLQGDFNYSIANFPRTVREMLAEALPWTIGLLVTTTVLSFILGTLLGAFMGWPRAPVFLQYVLPPLLALHALPYYLFGMVLMYVFAFKAGWFPIFGAYTAGTIPTPSLEFVLDVVRHATLPALSIILVAVGGWALTMRAMVVTIQGEDFITFADAKGLKGKTIFLRYAIRNTMLPQATAFALALGQIVAGGVLVEVVFGYPGIGTVLFAAIRQADWFLIQGAVFTVIVAIGLATLILDLVYPKLDPRITYRRA